MLFWGRLWSPTIYKPRDPARLIPSRVTPHRSTKSVSGLYTWRHPARAVYEYTDPLLASRQQRTAHGVKADFHGPLLTDSTTPPNPQSRCQRPSKCLQRVTAQAPCHFTKSSPQSCESVVAEARVVRTDKGAADLQGDSYADLRAACGRGRHVRAEPRAQRHLWLCVAAATPAHRPLRSYNGQAGLRSWRRAAGSWER